jgi:glycosyltransferase involved in cell wall biosynthesis
LVFIGNYYFNNRTPVAYYKKIIFGIDASNIRAGGGVTHLVEFLRNANPDSHGFEKVIVWGGKSTLDKIVDRDWLYKVNDPLLDGSLPYRLFWQCCRLKTLAEQVGCDVLFVPGGFDLSGFKTMVTMSQNLLPFSAQEISRYSHSLEIFRFYLLKVAQSRSFKKSDGVVFLTTYARDVVLKDTGSLRGKTVIIPHGINPRFFITPRPQRLLSDFSNDRPCRLLYVSVVEVYKHQWHVADAVAKLRSAGLPVVLELIGPSGGGMNRLHEALTRVDPEGKFISYKGVVPYEELHTSYASADIAIFASTCETFGMILLEAMSAGLPIACSNCSAMPEILGEAGVYFNPENSTDIACAIHTLMDSSDLRAQLAQAAFERAQRYSWKRCADETFRFLADIADTQFLGNNVHG